MSYVPIPKNIKNFYKKKVKRLDYKLNQALHYWKLRCKERESFVKPYMKHMVKMKILYKRLQDTEASYRKLFGREKRFFSSSRRKGRVRPLFVTNNEYERIVSYFFKARLNRRNHPPKGKYAVYLTQEHNRKLEKILSRRLPNVKKGGA
jgi:hypothetical protein